MNELRETTWKPHGQKPTLTHEDYDLFDEILSAYLFQNISEKKGWDGTAVGRNSKEVFQRILPLRSLTPFAAVLTVPFNAHVARNARVCGHLQGTFSTISDLSRRKSECPQHQRLHGTSPSENCAPGTGRKKQ